MMLKISEIISKKRDGYELTVDEIQTFISAVVNKSINDAQTGAMLMAMYLNNLSLNEIVNLTKAMIESGEKFQMKDFSKDILVDKHSTGGVGDKVSLILAPALASLGLKVPMMSGRSLNHTGGTLDKLESIPGFRVYLKLEEMRDCLTKAGCFICSTTKHFAPADATLYGFRDITSTVDNYGLIAASILSKKAIEGISVLVIDVKFGQGSFCKTEDDARKLAQIMMSIGKEVNLAVKAVVSEMNVPLGQYVGNSLEVIESVKCLRNELDNDLVDLVKFIGAVILHTKGLAKTFEEGKTMICRTLSDGTALKSFKCMLVCQGVSLKDAEELCAGRYCDVLPKSDYRTLLTSSKIGIVTSINSLNVGKACWIMGEKEGKKDLSVGVVLLKKVGDKVDKDEPWVDVHHSTTRLPANVKELLDESLEVCVNGDQKTTKKMIMKLLT